MKRRKAGDWLGWKAEWIKEEGKEMAKSLAVLFNRIEEEGEIPKQWQLTTIKSVRKKGNQDKLNESQRGIIHSECSIKSLWKSQRDSKWKTP